MSKPMLLLRLMGFYRPKPTTRLGRALRHLERALLVFLVCYLGLHAFPQMLFRHSVTVQGITLYSREALPATATARLTRAATLLQKSELAVPGRHESVFICNSPALFAFFGPTSRGAFAFSVPMTNHVFIANADPDHDRVYSAAPDYNTRSFSSVVAHEITHGLVRSHVGLLRALRLPGWIAEGYCDYVAQEGSFPLAKGRRLMIAGQNDESPSFRYFKYRQMVQYLMNERHLSFDQVVERASDADAVESETRQSLQQRAK